jgi:hypothetical protein
LHPDGEDDDAADSVNPTVKVLRDVEHGTHASANKPLPESRRAFLAKWNYALWSLQMPAPPH